MRWLAAPAVVLLAGLTVFASEPAGATSTPRSAPADTAAPAGTAASVVTAKSCAAEAAPGSAVCHAIRATPAQVAAAVKPNGLPAGLGATDLESAYLLPISRGGASVVAVVDAYNDPTAAADMARYRTTYALPACTGTCLRQVNQTGGTTLLPNDAGWAGAESLDLDMVSAACPRCQIILVEATSASFANLYAAEDEAVTLGAKFISNSWSGGESSSELSGDVHFNHPGVAITAPSGSAESPEYPGSSRYVTAVGGTTLTATTANARGWTESGWGGSGSGCSLYEARPSWQVITTPSCTKRAVSDVSAVADPNTGVAVYQTYGASGWQVYGGESVPVPIIAGVYALAGNPAAGTYPASYPYSHRTALFDITTGPNQGCGAPMCLPGVGWDGPTGLGTPNGSAAFTS